MKLIVNWISCMAAILLMAYLMPTRVRYDGYLAIVAAGTLLWLINTLVRPILRIISFPITILTLGLFSLILNTLMVMLADFLMPTVTFGGFWPSFVLAILVSIIQMVLNLVFKD
jgi:putative membrane protein